MLGVGVVGHLVLAFGGDPRGPEQPVILHHVHGRTSHGLNWQGFSGMTMHNDKIYFWAGCREFAYLSSISLKSTSPAMTLEA